MPDFVQAFRLGQVADLQLVAFGLRTSSKISMDAAAPDLVLIMISTFEHSFPAWEMAAPILQKRASFYTAGGFPALCEGPYEPKGCSQAPTLELDELSLLLKTASVGVEGIEVIDTSGLRAGVGRFGSSLGLGKSRSS